MLGVMPTSEALRAAQEQGLDLVEVNPKAEPPVCKLLDFGKYKYEEKKKAREQKRKQTSVDVKEIKLRPKTDTHDLETKLRAARRFLEWGNKVKFTVRFRGREITHPQKAQEQLDYLVKEVEDLANVEMRPMMEGRAMTLLIAPKPAVMQRVSALKAAAEKARQQAIKEGRTPPSTPAEEGEYDEDLDEDDDDDDEDDGDEEVNGAGDRATDRAGERR
jgi:translation initiation factor IF-3